MWRWLRRYLAEQPATSPDTADREADEKGVSGVIGLVSQVLKDKDQSVVLQDTVTRIAVVFTACACVLVIVVVGAGCAIIWVASKGMDGASLHYAVPVGFAGGGLVITVATMVVKHKVEMLLAGIRKKNRNSKTNAE